MVSLIIGQHLTADEPLQPTGSWGRARETSANAAQLQTHEIDFLVPGDVSIGVSRVDTELLVQT